MNQCSCVSQVESHLGCPISQFKSFGSSSKHAEIRPESFGIVVWRSVGTAPDILCLVWLRVRPSSGSRSEIFGRIPKSCRVPFSSAESYLRLVTHFKSLINYGSGPENGHETALELVSGANRVRSAPFFEPDPLERVSGPSSAGNRPKTEYKLQLPLPILSEGKF